jgi:hypothetical protein
MSYKPHQIAASDKIVKHLRDHRFAYLAGEPRTGKTRTALKAVQDAGYTAPLILTKKNAIPGWKSEMSALGVDHKVTNYEQASNILDSGESFDIVILDEAHNLGSRGRPTKRFREIRALAANLPLLCLSGTPVVDTPLGIYYQTAISRYGPFSRFKSFYEFFRAYGVPNQQWFHGRSVEQYNRSKPELLDEIGRHTVTLTQTDAGITAKARDRLHVVELRDDTQRLIDLAVRDSVLELGDMELMLESEMAVRNAVHQIESGAVLSEDVIFLLENDEVLEYCLRNFLPDDTAIMCHYRSTRQKFDPFYPHIFSSDGHAEGVDLSGFRNFVIVNSGYSGAKFVQRRERIVNMGVTKERIVHHITTTGGVSAQVYDAVKQKRDFNLQSFRSWRANKYLH